MRYITLEGVSPDVLHRAFLAAFADYPLPPRLDAEQFAAMLRRTGCQAACSIGAFDGEELVGFIHNGIRPWHGRLTAYDQGTAVLPKYRRQGITTALFAALLPILQAADVRRYLLEVLQQNEAAYRLYLKNSFRVTREFDCLTCVKDKLPKDAGHKVEIIENIAELDWATLPSMWDAEPSWQNSPDSLLASAAQHVAAIVRFDGEPVGYGIVDRGSGAIGQLAVSPAHRRVGIGRALLCALADEAEAEKLAVINVQSDTSGVAFLQAIGFGTTVRQYEMVLELGD